MSATKNIRAIGEFGEEWEHIEELESDKRQGTKDKGRETIGNYFKFYNYGNSQF